jgi:hypothetical protein
VPNLPRRIALCRSVVCFCFQPYAANRHSCMNKTRVQAFVCVAAIVSFPTRRARPRSSKSTARRPRAFRASTLTPGEASVRSEPRAFTPMSCRCACTCAFPCITASFALIHSHTFSFRFPTDRMGVLMSPPHRVSWRTTKATFPALERSCSQISLACEDLHVNTFISLVDASCMYAWLLEVQPRVDLINHTQCTPRGNKKIISD